jgi:hypothetical protein
MPDVGSMEDVGQQPSHYLLGIFAQIKHCGQEQCHGGEADLHCATSKVIFTAHLSMGVMQHMHRNVGPQFAHVFVLLNSLFGQTF